MASNPGLLQGQVLLGAVGAFNWSGGALVYDTNSCKGRFLNQTRAKAETAQYSYLGEAGPGDNQGGGVARKPPVGGGASAGMRRLCIKLH